MRLFTRLIVCAAAAIVLSGALFHLADAWLGEDTSVLAAGRLLVLETRRSQALRARAETVARSLEIKHNIIAELIAGRISFRKAIVQFQRANEMVENVDLHLLPVYRTPTTPQGVGRQVFIWARNMVSTWPSDKSQHLLAGLENEFQTLFGASKPVDGLEVRPLDTSPSGRTQAISAAW